MRELGQEKIYNSKYLKLKTLKKILVIKDYDKG